jgi:hypothetical protein
MYRVGAELLGLVVFAVAVDFGFGFVETTSGLLTFGLGLVFTSGRSFEATTGDFGFFLLLEATSTSPLRVGFDGGGVILTGGESESGTAFEGGCSLDAMEGTSSETGAELRFPHFEGLSAQAST